MRQQLIQYVDLLFAGASDAEEIKQEIRQNTLDRYDDLISQGKTPEAAYRLSIAGIGDINDILTLHTSVKAPAGAPVKVTVHPLDDEQFHQNRKIRATAIAMYILSPVPLFILSEFGADTMGLCLTLALVACATYLMILVRKNDPDADSPAKDEALTPLYLKKKQAGSIIWIAGLIVYLVLSILTQAWFITWLIFPILGCVEGLVKAILDLKEVAKYEN